MPHHRTTILANLLATRADLSMPLSNMGVSPFLGGTPPKTAWFPSGVPGIPPKGEAEPLVQATDPKCPSRLRFGQGACGTSFASKLAGGFGVELGG